MNFKVCQLLIKICLVPQILFRWPDHDDTGSLTHYRAVLRVLSVFQEIFI